MSVHKTDEESATRRRRSVGGKGERDGPSRDLHPPAASASPTPPAVCAREPSLLGSSQQGTDGHETIRLHRAGLGRTSPQSFCPHHLARLSPPPLSGIRAAAYARIALARPVGTDFAAAGLAPNCALTDRA